MLLVYFYATSHLVRAWSYNLRSRGELVLVTGLFTCYTHVYVKVLNCGWLMIRVVLVLHVYIRGYMYIGVLRILLLCFIVCYIRKCWAAIKLFCKYANHECVSRKRLAIYRESACYATDIERDCHLRLAILWGWIGRSMHLHDCCFIHGYAPLTLVI
jgi:hypothetical protein